MIARPVWARLERDGLQVIDVVVDRGYHPREIFARAGLPLRLMFQRNDDDVCSERVIFSTPHVDRRLRPTGTTPIDLPAQPPGEVRFTCGMGRYRGRILLLEARDTSIVQRILDRASRVGAAFSIVLIAAFGWLAVSGGDSTGAVAAVGGVTVALLAAWRWAFRRPAATA